MVNLKLSSVGNPSTEMLKRLACGAAARGAWCCVRLWSVLFHKTASVQLYQSQETFMTRCQKTLGVSNVYFLNINAKLSSPKVKSFAILTMCTYTVY